MEQKREDYPEEDDLLLQAFDILDLIAAGEEAKAQEKAAVLVATVRRLPAKAYRAFRAKCGVQALEGRIRYAGADAGIRIFGLLFGCRQVGPLQWAATLLEAVPILDRLCLKVAQGKYSLDALFNFWMFFRNHPEVELDAVQREALQKLDEFIVQLSERAVQVRALDEERPRQEKLLPELQAAFLRPMTEGEKMRQLDEADLLFSHRQRELAFLPLEELSRVVDDMLMARQRIRHLLEPEVPEIPDPITPARINRMADFGISKRYAEAAIRRHPVERRKLEEIAMGYEGRAS